MGQFFTYLDNNSSYAKLHALDIKESGRVQWYKGILGDRCLYTTTHNIVRTKIWCHQLCTFLFLVRRPDDCIARKCSISVN